MGLCTVADGDMTESGEYLNEDFGGGALLKVMGGIK